MVSAGAGAESVSERAAAEAIANGYAILVGDEGLWVDFDLIPFENDPPRDISLPRQRLAYRQAAMFIEWLNHLDAQAFGNLLLLVEDGENFKESVRASYGRGTLQLWHSFVSALKLGNRAAY